MIGKTTYLTAVCDACGKNFGTAPPHLADLCVELKAKGWWTDSIKCVCEECLKKARKVNDVLELTLIDKKGTDHGK